MKTKKNTLMLVCLGLGVFLLMSGEVRAQTTFDVTKLSVHLAFQPGPLTPGMMNLKARIDDTANGTFQQDLLAGTSTLQVQDADGFDVTVTLANCSQRGGRIHCSSTSGGKRIRAIALPLRGKDDLWYFSVRVKKLLESDTGFGPVAEPVDVTLTQASQVYTDVIPPVGGGEGECELRKRGARLRCRATSTVGLFTM